MDQKRKQVRLYFLKFPLVILPVLAVGLIVMLASGTTLGVCAGLLAWGAGATIGFRWMTSRPADAQMDSWLRADLESLEPRALAKCGLDSSELVRDPVVVIGPRFRRLGGAEFGFRKGADGQARFTPVDVTIINFTEHQLLVYQCAFDRTTGNPLNECVNEYFYNDVVSVATTSDAVTYSLDELGAHLLSRISNLAKSAVDGKIQVNNAETFVLATSGGSSVRVVLKDPVLIQSLGGGDLPLEWAEQAVQAVRKMLREKKAGALPLRNP
jgi:hypothetical protein